MWWGMPEILLGLGRLRQGGCYEPEAGLGYTKRS